MDVSVWIDRALVVVVVVVAAAAAVQLRFPAVFRIGRWCHTIARDEMTSSVACVAFYLFRVSDLARVDNQ